MCITTESIYSRALARRGLAVRQVTSSPDVPQGVNPAKVEGPSQSEEQNKNAVVKVVALRATSQVDPIYVMRELAAMKKEQKKLLDDMQQLRIQNEKLEKSLEKAQMEVTNSKLLSLEAQEKMRQQQEKYLQIKAQLDEEDSSSLRNDDQDGESQEGDQAFDDGRSAPAVAFGRGGRGGNKRGTTRTRPPFQAQIQQPFSVAEQSNKHAPMPENKRHRSGADLVPQIINVPLIPQRHMQHSAQSKQLSRDGLAIIVYDLFEKPPKVSALTPAMGNLLGVDPADLIGVPWYELVHSNMESQTMAAMTKAIQTGAPVQITELYRHSNGGFIHTTDTHTVVLDTSGSPHFDSVNVVLVPQQRKQYQHRRQSASSNRRTAQKLQETETLHPVPELQVPSEVQPVTDGIEPFSTPAYLQPNQVNRAETDEQIGGEPESQPVFDDAEPPVMGMTVPSGTIELTEDPQQQQHQVQGHQEQQSPQPLPSLAAVTETTLPDSNSLFFDDRFDASGTAVSDGNPSGSSEFYGYPYS